MRSSDILREAVTNTKRNKIRTLLTVIAVFVGAFTLALTNSIGTGVSTYIGAQLDQIGNEGMMSVSKPNPDAETVEPGQPTKFKESSASSQETQLAEATAGMGFALGVLNDDDLEKLATIPGVDRVEPTIMAQPKYLMGSDGEKWNVTPNIAASVMTPNLTAGKAFTLDGDANEVIIPEVFVETFGYTNDAEAVGETVTLVIEDTLRQEQSVEAIIVGVNNKSLFGDAVSFNKNLSQALLDASKEGIPADMIPENNYISAILHIDQDLDKDGIEALKADLTAEGYDGSTIKDQLGSIQAVIDGIIGVLNGFAIIALIAAGFGIVNTLLMSVQERTREIGLMKAMGMPSRKIYGLFSTEAVFIGFLGSAVGVLAAFALGTGINSILSTTLLADLPGLTISLFTAPDVLTVFGLVMAISLLAGTIPSIKAAKQNPIDALRYE